MGYCWPNVNPTNWLYRLRMATSAMSSSPSESNRWYKRPKRGCRRGFGSGARAASRRSSAKRREADLACAPSATTTGTFPPGSGSSRCSTRARSRRWDADLRHRPIRWASSIASLYRADQAGAEADRAGRRGRGRHRHDPCPARSVRRDRLGVHHGQHGLGGGREAYPHRRSAPRAAVAADHHFRLRRRRGCTRASSR